MTGDYCNELFRLPVNSRSGSHTVYQTSKVSNHNKNGSHKYMYQHGPFSLSGEHALSRVNRKRQLSLESMLEFGVTEAVGAERDASAPARKSLKSEDRQRAAQAHFYIYSTQVISKETLRDPMFIKLMQVMGTCKRAHREGGVSEPAILNVKKLYEFVEAEYAVFQQYLALVMARKIEMSRGAAFAQMVHDGGTLRNHWKHQALGIQLVDPLWQANLVICLGLVPCLDGTAPAVADILRDVMHSHDLDFGTVIASSMQDGAAVAVASELGMEKESCLMHSADKLGAAGIGDLVRSKNKVEINPFSEGQAVMSTATGIATYFNYSSRFEQLVAVAGSVCTVIRLRKDLNGTRIAAKWNLLYSLLRNEPALRMYAAAYAAEITTSDGSTKWTSIEGDWKIFREFEAVLFITQKLTYLAQTEKQFAGAYGCLIKTRVGKDLFAESIAVFDPAAAYTGAELPRKMVPVSDLSSVAKTCLERAQLEYQRRYQGNVTETIDSALIGTGIVMSDRELLCTLLDIRTCRATHLTDEQRHRAYALLEDLYVSFSRGVPKEKPGLADGDFVAEPVAGAIHNDEKQLLGTAVASAHGVGAVLEDDAWTDTEEEGEEPLDADAKLELEREEARRACKSAYKALRTRSQKLFSTSEWQQYVNFVPSEEEEERYDFEPADAMIKLLYMDMGPVYLQLETEVNLGWLPRMASCSRGQLGALMAESFCERILSCAKQVLHAERLSLKPEEYEKIVILRMNRAFMEYMRKNHAKYAKA